mgnify:CR=1 FL=1
MKRKDFLKLSSASALFLGLNPDRLDAFSIEESHDLINKNSQYMGDYSAPKLKTVRVAFIGVGARGTGHARQIATIEGTEVVAISDLYQDLVQRSIDNCKEIGKGERHNEIAMYSGGENKWKLMLKEVKPDAVFISTNWDNHAPMVIEAMNSGAHAFVEVPMATTIEDMWEIINTSEKTRKHCMMMENVNYGRDEMMYLNMCRKGVIGDFLHAEAAYIHELRFQMEEQKRGTGSWRTHQYEKKKGNLYPTHGLGPVSQYMNLLRTEDTFKTLVSFSSPSAGRKIFAKDNFNKNHKWNKLNFQNGDINTTVIKTYLGRTIMVQWDETSPRPYTRLNLIQGTKGALAGGPTRAAFDGGFENFTKGSHQWIKDDGIKRLYEKYDHPLYKRLNEKTKDSGHGGMDGIMMYRIVECLKNGTPLDQNVYEGCAWSALIELTSNSVNNNGEPQEFPDFTRGNWVNTKPFDI